MAFVYHALYHVVIENGEKMLVHETQWGQHRLTGDDLTRYQADMEEAFEQFNIDLNAGRIVVSEITEEVTTASGQKITVQIGDKLTFPGATSKYEFHSKFYEWADIMRQDANTIYNEPGWIDATPKYPMTTELHKTIDTDITNSPITIHNWAVATLTSDELDQYIMAESRNNALMQSYIDAGLMTQEALTETVFVSAIGQSITIPIGQKTTLAPGVTVLDIPIDPEYGAWHARYSSDHTINYNPTVQL